MKLAEFLEEVVTGGEGWFNLCHAKANGTGWKEEWFRYPNQLNDICSRIGQLKAENVYFSPYLFETKQSTKEAAIVGRTIVADLDDANVLTIQPRPSILVQTSAGRHQAYWILTDALSRNAHEHLSKRITYGIPACDRTGWFIGKRVRVPGTNNYKWDRDSDIVRVLPSTHKQHTAADFQHLPEIPTRSTNSNEEAGDADNFIRDALTVSSGPQEFLEKVRSKLPPKVVTQYNFEARDRSAALWTLNIAAFRAGLSSKEVFFLARGSANNKFTSLRFNGDVELMKDVLRAQQQVYSEHMSGDYREKIKEIRRFPGLGHEKLAYLAQTVRENMKARGQFINCADGTSWFIDNVLGKPMAVLARSEALQTTLDAWYGLNPIERESAYTIGHLSSYVAGLPPVGRLAALSYYDMDTNALYLHTGRKEVLRVTSRDITTVTNGYDSLVFHWASLNETINPHYKHYDTKWEDILFENALDNMIGLKISEAKALLKVWMLMLLLRSSVVTRPILCIFGQPGAGKSTLFRRVYTLLYGRGRSLSSITTPDNFDYATASDPLVVFDNVDTWERWLPDRLALAAAVSEVKKRKLYTNNDTITLTRQAFIGLTAHNPKFGREDVTDRLIILTLERLKKFDSETDILGYIHSNRSTIWGLIIQDIQKILSTEVPVSGFTDFRIQDFARYGAWIAKAVGILDEFNSALATIVSEQKTFAMEEDGLLLDALYKYLTIKHNSNEEQVFRPPSNWWALLEPHSRDMQAFQRQYKNAVVLGKKFWTLHDAMKGMFFVDWEVDEKRNTRLWKFRLKEPPRINGVANPNGVAVPTPFKVRNETA